jgi:hypothetical protein
MPATFLTFQRFNDPALAEAVAEKLKENGIDYRIQGDGGPVEAMLITTTAVPSVSLQIPGHEFPRAHTILETFYAGQLGDVDPDYYLYTFIDEELMEIVSKPDEWGHFDYVLARKQLADRGKPIDDAEAAELRRVRLKQLADPNYIADDGSLRSPISRTPVVFSHLVASHARTLPDGKQVYSHSPAQRKRARTLTLVVVLALVLFLLKMLLQRH